MNRQIEFRGKTFGGDWVCGDYFKTPLTDEATNSKPEDGWFFLIGKVRHCISDDGCVYEVDPKTIGEYINKKDNKNNKIFEGDKLKIYNYNYNYEYGVEHKSLKSIYYGIVECYSDITGFKINTRIKENEDKKIPEREPYEEFEDCEIIERR